MQVHAAVAPPSEAEGRGISGDTPRPGTGPCKAPWNHCSTITNNYYLSYLPES